MEIIKKIQEKQENILNSKPVTVAFLGDSITQGCFECYLDTKKQIQTVFDYSSSYSQRFKEIMNILYPSVQINVINSGISGDNAINGNKRFDRDITPYNPDLVVVAFGINDSCQGKEKVNDYINALEEIFEKVKKIGAECIFVAQNTMNTKVSYSLKTEEEKKTAEFFAKVQNDGVVKYYLDRAKELATKKGIKVCDMYSVWEKMYQSGVDTTELLANKYNHPIRKFHYYIAIKLVETIFEN